MDDLTKYIECETCEGNYNEDFGIPNDIEIGWLLWRLNKNSTHLVVQEGIEQFNTIKLNKEQLRQFLGALQQLYNKME